MPHRARLLGFAFTNADFLFEVDAKGMIQFAAGAAQDLVAGGDLVGKPADSLFKPPESAKFATLSRGLKSGDRAGPYRLTLATGAQANLAMFRLPENGDAVSCTLVRQAGAKILLDAATGLSSRDGFTAALENAGGKDTLTLIDVPGLPQLCDQLSPEKAEALMRRIGENLQSSGATAAGRISRTGFGALAPASKGALGLARRIADAITAGGLKAPRMEEAHVTLDAPGLTPEQRLMALRYTIGRFAEQGRVAIGEDDIATAFEGMMQETERRLAGMNRLVGDGAFEIAY